METRAVLITIVAVRIMLEQMDSAIKARDSLCAIKAARLDVVKLIAVVISQFHDSSALNWHISV